MKVCSFEGCKREQRTKGLCRFHYRKQAQEGTECSFDGCGRRVEARGLCKTHYGQFTKGEELQPIAVKRPYRKSEDILAEIATGFLTCNGWCGRKLPLDDYTKHAYDVGGYSQYCRECKRNKKLRENYGLSADDWDELFDSQGRCCRICRSTDSGGSWATDHDHNCCPTKSKSCGRCVRAILCAHCNKAEGFLSATPNPVETAIRLAVYIANNHVQLRADDYESAAKFYGWEK